MGKDEEKHSTRRHHNVEHVTEQASDTGGTSEGRKLTRTLQMAMITNELGKLRLYQGDDTVLSKDWFQAADYVPDLHFAAFCGDLPSVKRLIKGSDDSNLDPDSGIEDGPKLIKEVKQRKGEYYGRENYVGFFVGTTPLMMAAQQGHLAVVKYLIEYAHVDVNGCDSLGLTSLSLACAFNHEAVAKYLLSHHAQRNCQDNKYGMTPLILATLNNHKNMCMFLLNHRVNINTTDKYGRQAIHYAALNYNWELVDILRRHGNEILNARDHNQNTPLHLLVSDFDIDPEKVDTNISNAEMTILSGITRRISMYRNCTVDIKRDKQRGRDILGEEHDCLVNMINHGADITAINDLGQTPLLVLCARLTPVIFSQGYLHIEQPTITQTLLVMLKLLIRYGSSTDIVDFTGMNALSLCIRQKNWLAVKMLSPDGIKVRSEVTVDPFKTLPHAIAAFGWSNLFHHKQIEKDIEFISSAATERNKLCSISKMVKRIL